MKIRDPLPDWTLEDALHACSVARGLVETQFQHPCSLPSTCSKRVHDWIKYSGGIARDTMANTIQLKECQYPVSRIVRDSIDQLCKCAGAGHGAIRSSGDAYPARKAIDALLFPFMMAETAYVAKLVANRMITNRRLYEKIRGVDLTSILTIILRFRDELSGRGFFSENETRMICSESVPYEFEVVRSSTPGLGGRVLRQMLRDGVSDTSVLARDAAVTEEEIRLEVKNASETKTIPVCLYSEDPRIVTFKGPGFHLWQMNDLVEVDIDPNFCADRHIVDWQTVGSLRTLGADKELAYSASIENNVTAIHARELDLSIGLDGWFLPTDDLARVGSVIWSFSGVPQFVKLLPRDQKRELVAGSVKHMLHHHRERIIQEDGILFEFMSPETSMGFFKLLKDDFHILCKRPTKTTCMVYDCGIPELARNLSLSKEEFLLLMRIYRPDYTDEKIDDVRDERLFRQIMSDLLFEKDGLTCSQLSEELLMEEKVVKEIADRMTEDMQIASSGSRYHFSIDSGDLYSFINDVQIRDAMRFE